MERVEARRALAVAALIACAAGCDGGGSGSGPISLQDLPARAEMVVCQAAVACQVYPDEASCRAAVTTNLGQIQADVAAGKITYDPTQAGACLDSATAVLACRLSAPRIRQANACDRTFVGSVAAGGACLINEDCVSGHCTMAPCLTGMCCAGTCDAQQPKGVPIGGACMSSADCVEGALCQLLATPSTCAAPKPAGASCTVSDECVDGTACLPAGAGVIAHACTRPPSRGEPCVGASTCDDSVDFCDPTTMKCAARLGPGSPCDPMAIACALYATCDPTSHTCVTRGGVGADCTKVPCQSNLRCTSGTCAAPAAKVVCPQP
jgi:hypothetical protein